MEYSPFSTTIADSSIPIDVYDNSRQPSSNANNRSLLTSNRSPPTSPPQIRPEQPFTKQNRRLQLRNAGFRGALFSSSSTSTRRISPHVSAWRNASIGSEPDAYKENSGVDFNHQNSSYRGLNNSQNRRSSILQEIGNSTQRRKIRPSQPLITSIFHDSPPGSPTASRPPSISIPKTSKKLEPYSNFDSQDFHDIEEDNMESRRASSSWKSPFVSLGRSTRQNLKTREGRRDASRYIEHLENQLEATLSRADSTDSEAHAARFKALNTEHRMLKQELAEWEEKFETRVQDDTAVILERESQLRARVRTLGRDLEAKENRVRELEWEIEMDSHKLRNMEAINSTNRSLERRIDVLTELLAQSPTRTENEHLTHPDETDGASSTGNGPHRTPRPKSMFSKMPLSPIRRPIFQPLTVPDSNTGSGAPLDPVQDCDTLEELAHSNDPKCEDGLADVKAISELESVDSGLGDSCSNPSTRAPGSKRSSMMSHASTNSSLWGTSLPLSPEFQGKLPYRRRKMRRFPSGACTLKPLVLPVSSTTLSPPHLLPSPVQHSYSRYSTIRSRRYSTRDDLSLYGDEFDGQHEDTLDALEGNTCQYQSFEDAIANYDLSDMPDEAFEEGAIDSGPYGDVQSSFGNSINPAEVFDTPCSALDGWIEPSKRLSIRRLPKTSPYSTATRATSTNTSGQSIRRYMARNASHRSGINTRTNNAYTSSGTANPNVTIGANSKWTINIQRVIAYSRSIARCIFTSALHSNWKRLGKLSWWFLGFIMGSQTRNECFKRHLQSGVIKHETPVNTSSLAVSNTPCPSRRRVLSGTRLSTHELSRSTRTTKLTDSSKCESQDPVGLSLVAPNATESIRHWMKFSVALVLAIGLAVRDGPTSLMCECTMEDGSCTTHPTTNKISRQDDEALQGSLPPESVLHYDALDNDPLVLSDDNNCYQNVMATSTETATQPD